MYFPFSCAVRNNFNDLERAGRGFAGGHEGDPDRDAFGPCQGKEQLEIIPIRGSVPDEKIVGPGLERRQLRHEPVNIDAAILPAGG